MHIPDDLKSTELEVLAWNDHFLGDDFLAPVEVENPGGPDISLRFTRDRERLGQVDAVWFHGPTVRDMPRRADKRQPWVLMSMESDTNYPALKNPVALKIFDILMTYRLDADVPCPYPSWHEYGGFALPATARSGTSPGALASYIASNPVAHRDDYVRDLMRHVPVDSYGRCLNNCAPPGFVRGGWDAGAWNSILSVLPRYKFYLAFENSLTTDYVTERVFHALACGSVPVYMGAPNVREFMPDDAAVIDTADFAGPRELADYLHTLDGDDEAYRRHLAWRQEGVSDPFRALVDLGSIDPRKRLAVKLAHGCDASCNCGGRVRKPSG